MARKFKDIESPRSGRRVPATAAHSFAVPSREKTGRNKRLDGTLVVANFGMEIGATFLAEKREQCGSWNGLSEIEGMQMTTPTVNNNPGRAEKSRFSTPSRYGMTCLRHALQLLCGLLLLADIAAAQAAGRAFSDDFEGGNLSKWSADGNRNMCKIVQRGIDGSTPHGGQNMMECNWNGTVAWDDPNAYTTVVLPQEAWPYSRELFIRFWVKYDHDVSHTYGGKVMRLFPPDKLDGFYIIAQMASAGGPAQVVWETFNGAAGPTFWGAGTPLGDHHWHKLEIYIKASSSSDGVARFWFDGTLKSEVTNTATVASGHTWGPLYLMSNWSNNPGWDHGANNHIYWDDVEVFTDNAGGATGSMSDATISAGMLPNPPSGVVVH